MGGDMLEVLGRLQAIEEAETCAPGEGAFVSDPSIVDEQCPTATGSSPALSAGSGLQVIG